MNPLTLLNSLPGALAQGLIWGIMAIGVAITYKILDYADLTVDNSLCTGGAVAAVCIIGGMNPLLALLCAVLAGALAGLCTGLLHTVLGIPAILSGILTQLALYSINMHIMGGKSNLTVSRTQYQLLLSSAKVPAAILVSGIFVIAIVALLYWFFGTQLGCAIRATGNNEHMARAQGISTNRMKVLGLMISNGLVGLSGALLAQYQGNSDINMGRGAIVIGLAAVVIGKALLGKRKTSPCAFLPPPWALWLTTLFSPSSSGPVFPPPISSSSRPWLSPCSWPSPISAKMVRPSSRQRRFRRMLKLENIHKTFHAGTVNQKIALDGLSLTLNDGDFVTVIGGNGAGKSTLLNTIAGTFPVDSGAITIDGEDITDLSEESAPAFWAACSRTP